MGKKNVGAIIAPYFNILLTLLVSFFAYLTFALVFFNLNQIKYALVVFLGIVSFFLVFRNFSEREDRKGANFLFKLSVVIFGIYLINYPLSFLKLRGFQIPIPLFLMSNFTAIFISVYTLQRKEIVKTINNTDKAKQKIFKKKEERKSGDIVICENIDTGNPVILPADDRFLHMLILGPTGSGKTSQVIIPMLNQDLANKEMGVTVIDPKSDLAENVYALAKINGREVTYFNPTSSDCPYFNPLFGDESEVIENMATTFKMLNPDSPQFFLDMNEQLIRHSLTVLKRLYGNNATLIDLSRLIQNSAGAGRGIVIEFTRISSSTQEIAKENADIADWFLNDYLTEKSKSYEHCSGLRSQVTKIISNPHLRRVLNPPNGLNDIDFEKHLAEGGVMAITTSQGDLRDLSRFLGYFIILQFQSAVFRRPGNENTRRHHALYIDEFQTYSTPGFSDMLTMGRSYRVASHLATQNRALMAMGAGRDGKNFVDLVSTNARNVIIFPGGSTADAEFYAKQFGEIKAMKKEVGITRKKYNPLYGFEKIGLPSENIREVEKLEPRFSATDIIYREFGEIIYCIVKNKTLQPADAGKVKFVPIETKRAMDEIVAEYNKHHIRKKDQPIVEEKTYSDLEDIEINFDDEFVDIAQDKKIVENIADSSSLENKKLETRHEPKEKKQKEISKTKDPVELVALFSSDEDDLI